MQFRKKLNRVHWGYFNAWQKQIENCQQTNAKMSIDKCKIHMKVLYLSAMYFIFVCYVFCICLLTNKIQMQTSWVGLSTIPPLTWKQVGWGTWLYIYLYWLLSVNTIRLEVIQAKASAWPPRLASSNLDESVSNIILYQCVHIYIYVYMLELVILCIATL